MSAPLDQNMPFAGVRGGSEPRHGCQSVNGDRPGAGQTGVTDVVPGCQVEGELAVRAGVPDCAGDRC